MHNINILVDSVIRVDLSSGRRMGASLPQVYEALVADEVEAFPALRPHQRHAWHAFLAQLGAMAMHKAGVGEPPGDADGWRGLLREMTAGEWPDDEPWRLVVDDITAPAFMQPAARSADKEKDYKTSVATPDGLDMLVTSKNHDLKMAVASDAGADDWIFALVSLQTQGGFAGSGNYGVSRMNGGASSRPAFSLTPSERVGAHIRRDMTVLAKGFITEDAPSDAGSTLLWTRAWDGGKAEALPFAQLKNRLYIEICRRIRLRHSEGEGLWAIKATSGGARIEAKAQKGRTGDPWTPVDRKNGKALTLGAGGFNYKRVAQYLTGDDWKLPKLCEATESERGSADTMRLVARAMVRGQGKTEGYYERVIPVRKKMQTAMMRGGGDRDELGEIADGRIVEVGKVQRILSHAIQVFAAGGDADGLSAEHRRLAQPWLNRLDEVVDADFFDALQVELEADDADERKRIRNEWLMNGRDGVVDRARDTLREAQDALPCAAIRRYKAQVRSDGMFEGRIRGAAAGLPFLFAEERGDNDDDND